jgi:hypothetical protein
MTRVFDTSCVRCINGSSGSVCKIWAYQFRWLEGDATTMIISVIEFQHIIIRKLSMNELDVKNVTRRGLDLVLLSKDLDDITKNVTIL